MLLSMTEACCNMERSSVLIAIYITALLYCRVVTDTLKTPQAAEKVNDLSCHVCDSMEAGEHCSHLKENDTSFVLKCQGDSRTCMVKRYSYMIIAENKTKTYIWHLWSLKRKCTNKCDPGCIVIGERNKLSACTACCGGDLCNTMDGSPHHRQSSLVTVFCIVALTAFIS